nr:tRNA (guanosine(37)-N1)-methyltransferase TrmD [Anaerolineae bacterium]
MFAGPMTCSMLKRAQEQEQLVISLHNIRDYTTDKHRVADAPPYGGGGGMIMKPEPLIAAVEAVVPQGIPVILLSPQGRVFNQRLAEELAEKPGFALICGHYEGVDERVRETVVTDEISVGDFVLTGGELAAMIIIDAVTRLQPGVLGDPTGAAEDSHTTGLLEHPHYTRPPEYRGMQVPDVLLSGHAARIAAWRREQSLRRTWERRPDLLLSASLSEADRAFLLELAKEDIEQRKKGS